MTEVIVRYNDVLNLSTHNIIILITTCKHNILHVFAWNIHIFFEIPVCIIKFVLFFVNNSYRRNNRFYDEANIFLKSQKHENKLGRA